MSGMTCTELGPLDVHHSLTYQYVFSPASSTMTSLREFPRILPAGGHTIMSFGCSPSVRTCKYVINGLLYRIRTNLFILYILYVM